MGLFDEQLEKVRTFLSDERGAGKVREFRAGSRPPWPAGQSLVLEEDTALELGNPRVASLSLLLWTEGDGVDDGLISLVGPDVEEASGSIPLAQVLIVGGSFSNEYDSYRDIRDAVYDTHLKGFAVRTMPSRQSIWCRVGRDAMEEGFSIADLGAALIGALEGVEQVSYAEALFVTSSQEDVIRLSDAATGSQRVVDAMMKMYQEKNFDCSSCEYSDVCESVMELKKIREKLAGEKAV